VKELKNWKQKLKILQQHNFERMTKKFCFIYFSFILNEEIDYLEKNIPRNSPNFFLDFQIFLIFPQKPSNFFLSVFSVFFQQQKKKYMKKFFEKIKKKIHQNFLSQSQRENS